MAGEIPLIRMEQGATELTVPSSCFISIESGGLIEVEGGGQIDVASGGHIDFESGGYWQLPLTTGAGSLSVPALGVTRMIPVSTGNNYTLPTAIPGVYHLAYVVAGPSTGQEAYIDSTSAQFIIPGSTLSTGLMMGSTGSTGASQSVLLMAVNSTEWLVITKTTGIVGT